MFDVYFWSVIAFFAILAALIYRDRKNVEFQNYILAMRRTKRGRQFIDRTAQSSPKLWIVLSTLAVVAAFGFMAYGLYLILLSTQLVVEKVITMPAIQFILPVPQAQPITGIGFIGVPFWFWILIVPFVLFPHEFAHGIIARVTKIKVKTVGLIQLLIWSGAFVEPDEKQIKKSKLINKLRIFSVGSIANISIALFFIFLTSYLVWPIFMPNGLVITNVVQGSSADAAGLKSGMVLKAIEGRDVKVDYDVFAATYGYLLFKGYNLTAEDLKGLSSSVEIAIALNNLKPNQTISVQTDNGAYNLKLSGRPENSSLPYMGLVAITATNNDFMFEFVFPLVWWLTTLSQLVAIFNLLPIYPLDGGLMVEAVAEEVSKKHAKKIVKIVTSLVLALLVFNFVGPSIIGALF